MTVKVKHGKFRLAIWLPDSLIGFGLKCYVKHENKNTERRGVKINAVGSKEIKKIKKELKKAKKIHGKLEIVSVKAADGTRVKVTL